MNSNDSKQVTCVICSREMTVTQCSRNRYSGTCPYCKTYDNGTARGRLVTNAESSLCDADGHEWTWNRNRRTCKRCGHWEELVRTDSPSIGYEWMIVDSRDKRSRGDGR